MIITLEWTDAGIRFIDQTKLPTEETYITATSYQQVIDRNASGALQPTGQYRCTGCRNIFATIRAWWEPRRAPEFKASSFKPSSFAGLG